MKQIFNVYDVNVDLNTEDLELSVNTEINFTPTSKKNLKSLLLESLTSEEKIKEEFFKEDYIRKEFEKSNPNIEYDLVMFNYSGLSFTYSIERMPTSSIKYKIDMTFTAPIVVKEDIKTLLGVVQQYHKENFNIELETNENYLISLKEQDQAFLDTLDILNKQEQDLEKIMHSIKLKC